MLDINLKKLIKKKRTLTFTSHYTEILTKDGSGPKIKAKTVKLLDKNIVEISLWHGNTQVFLSSQKATN